MYKHYEPLTEVEVETLDELSTQVSYRLSNGSRCRMGANREKARSIYRYAKWYDWNKAQRETFRVGFTEEVIGKTIQGWFLHIPAKTGFLDVMTYWVDKINSGTVVCTALRDRQTIILDGKPIELRKGEQIGFSLRTVHSIPKSEFGQLWACVMIRGDHEKLEG